MFSSLLGPASPHSALIPKVVMSTAVATTDAEHHSVGVDGHTTNQIKFSNAQQDVRCTEPLAAELCLSK